MGNNFGLNVLFSVVSKSIDLVMEGDGVVLGAELSFGTLL